MMNPIPSRPAAGDGASTPSRLDRLQAAVPLLGPMLVASVLLFAGFLYYLPGVEYSRSPDHYRAWAFPAFRYSDIIWLYLRDGLAAHPIPYLDYPLEYPPLTGFVSWVASLAPGLPGYYVASWAMNAAGILGAIWALTRIPGASPWPLAAAPALFFYPGHQFDPVAIGVTAAAIAACALGRPRLGAFGLAAGVSLKLFPLAFLAALCADHLRHRRWRALVETCLIAVGVTLIVNLPLAVTNPGNWSFFFRWNRDRLADSGPWVLWRDMPTSTLTMASLVTVAVGGLLISLWAFRMGGPLTATLGATALLWWLLANKTFTTHLILWVFLALALLRAPLWLWLATAAVDVIGFQIGNYLNLYNVPAYQSPALIHSAVVHIYDPLQVARSLVLLAGVGWGIWQLRRRRADPIWPLTRAVIPRNRAVPAAVTDIFVRTAPAVRRWAVPVAVGASYLVAAIVMTWPLAANLASVTAPGFDPLLQIWLSQWIQHALVTNPAGMYDANIFHPFPTTLAYTDANFPGALIAWPLDLVGRDPILTNNILTIGSFVAAAGGVYAVSIRLTGNRAASWLAGFAYAFVPWRMVHLWHLNWLETAWMPWTLLAFLRLLERPTLARAIVLGILAAIATLTSFYLSVQVAILIGLLLIAAMLGDTRARQFALIRGVAVAALVAAVIAGPLYLPYLKVRDEQGLQRTIAEAHEYKAIPASWLSLAPWDVPTPIQRVLGVRAGENRALSTVGQERHADGHQHAEIVTEDALYPGIWTLLAAGAGVVLWKRRWLAFGFGAVALTAAVLSLGPTLGPATTGPPLPYWWLFENAPLFTAMRAPARLGGLTALALAILAALGVAAIWTWLSARLPQGRVRGAGVAAFACALLLLVLDLAAFPVPLEPVDFDHQDRAAWSWLADQPEGAVMDFPAESIFADPAGSSVRRHVGLTMLGSTLNWLPLVNGNSGFIPQSYSDLLERFVGNLPRNDGTLALAISHADRETLPLLQQLGVRYLVVHRDRYREEDWPAVESALAEAAPLVEPAATFGDISIYSVHVPLSPPPRPEARLYAPTLLGANDPWSPVLVLAADGDLPSLAAYTRPTTVSAQWFDTEGRPLHREGWAFPVPAVLDSPEMICLPGECRASTLAVDPGDLAPPRLGWRPEKPGHYVVRLSLSGDFPMVCMVDLDIRSEPELAAGDDQTPRWAECTAENGFPVNDPGRPPYAVTPPSVTLAGDRVAVSVDLTARNSDEIRGWWLLAPAGAAEPWREAIWRAPEIQRILSPGDPASFSWIETLPADLPEGVYSLTLWFHNRGETGWEHALGGGFGIGPIVVENGKARWAGPLRLGPLPRIVAPAGTTVPLDLAISGMDGKRDCSIDWLIVNTDGSLIGRGSRDECGRVDVRVSATAPPGRYRLTVQVFGESGDNPRLEDALTVALVVLESNRPGEPR